MRERADLVVHSAGQLLTIRGTSVRRGKQAGELAVIANGGLAIAAGRIMAVGASDSIRRTYEAPQEIDAGGRTVLPGLVDAHTHLVFAGSRGEEFVQRIRGDTYLQIMAAGGGIMSTVRATRSASLQDLVRSAEARLRTMLRHGTTTAEVKTGYGLAVEDELKCFSAIIALQKVQPVDLVPTFLGAHAVPAEFKGRSDEYVDLVVNEMLPAMLQLHAQDWRPRYAPVPLACDVFCDEGAFDVAQSRRVLSAARSLGQSVRVHADEFAHLGAAAMAAELHAISAEHLVLTTPQEMSLLANSGTVAVLLPGTPFGLGTQEYARARLMIERGLPIALGTDLNPGTCYCESLPFMISLACRYMRITPEEAIVAATANAAHALCRGHEVGSLTPGYMADLVILNGDDYRDLAYRFGSNLVRTVVKSGRVVASAD